MKNQIKNKNWRKVKLGDIAEKIDYGYTASAIQDPVGPKFLRITDIVPDIINWDSVPYCRINEQKFQKYKLENGDIIIARTGATTGYAKQFKDNRDTIFASYLVRVRPSKDVNTKFVGLIVQSDAYKDFIKLNLTGAAQPQANAKILTSFKFLLPPFSTQKQIADILSAYDELIENNTKRIKILEEIAQTIYKEWFIKFNFPVELVKSEKLKVKSKKNVGYKKAGGKMINSKTEFGKIPEGWEVKEVGDIIRRVQSGKKYNNKTVSKKGKVPVLDQGKSGIIGYHNDEPGVIASEDNPIIVFANHTCYQNLIMFPFSAIQNILPFYPSDDYPRSIYWLHWATKDLIELSDYKGHWPEFIKKVVVVPTQKISENFEQKITSIIIEKLKLENINQKLRQARDLLLPKLISGQIEV